VLRSLIDRVRSEKNVDVVLTPDYHHLTRSPVTWLMLLSELGDAGAQIDTPESLEKHLEDRRHGADQA
jgi:hypothetical protein